MLRRTCLILTVLVVIMHGTIYPALNDEIKITLEDKLIREFSPDGLILDFYIGITNSSTKTYYLSGYQYRFMVEEQEFIRLQTPLGNDLRIEPRGRTPIRLPVKITYQLLYDNITGLEPGSIAACYMMGEFAFSDGRRNRGRLPIAFTGEFPLFVAPQITLGEIRIKTLTVGGADIDLAVVYANQNSFELPLELIDYSVKFGGHPIGSGRIRGDGSLDTGRENTISIPLLLNFFEVGKEVNGLLQQNSINSQFSGKIELNTAWGRMTLPFDRKVTAPVKRSE